MYLLALLAISQVALFLALHFKAKEILMTLDQLKSQVTATLDAEEAAAKLLIELAKMLEASKNDPVKIQELADQLKERTDSLSAAIVAGTPAQ